MAKKEKYIYDPHNLSYRKVTQTMKNKLIKIMTHFLAAIVLSVIFTILFTSVFDTTGEKKLMRENKIMEFNYEKLEKKFDRVLLVLNDIQKRDDNIYRVIFESDPIPTSVRQSILGGNNKYNKFKDLTNSELIIETNKKVDKITKQLVVQSKSYDDIVELIKTKEKMLASIPQIQPIDNKDLHRIGSGFGPRMHPILKFVRMHSGLDFSAPTGTKIYATGNGKIIKAKYSSGFGLLITIDHGFGYKTNYAHLSKILVRKGQRIKRGEVIGLLGNTGLSTAPHLHYEVVKKGKKVNPINYFFGDLTPEQYKKVVEISLNSGQSFD